MQGHQHEELNAFVPDEDDLFQVDEHFGLPKGTTYKTMCLLGEPTLLNEKLAALGIQLGDWGILPKDQRPQWRVLMQELSVGTQYWKDPDLLLVPEMEIENLKDFEDNMANQITVISPYWHHSTWVFDDPAVDLVKEPFVSGVPEMIDDLVADLPNARDGFRLLFSASPFPGYQRQLSWVREEMEGNWYFDTETNSEGWLCPAMFKYFSEAPAELYVKAESKSS